MQTQNRFFDDLARMAGGTLGLLTGLRTEVEAMVRQQMQRLLGDMQLVSREEFEAVKEMAAKARIEQEVAEKRLAALESALAKTSGTRRD
ncbi:MAG: accessory factor UbiK family protein [Alphaproteobacteria bacterium]|nr:accessory factor UbiK family protein [Alphaproteobacteria bacterium]